jgi:hypothetical protein
MASYKYGTIAPIKAELEDLVNLIAKELEITSWRFNIEDVAPIDYTKDLALAEFLFARGAMTIRELIDNFGNKFGLTYEDNELYLDERFINNQPLDNLMNQSEVNPTLEVDSILNDFENSLRGEPLEPRESIDGKEDDNSLADSVEAVTE